MLGFRNQLIWVFLQFFNLVSKTPSLIITFPERNPHFIRNRTKLLCFHWLRAVKHDRMFQNLTNLHKAVIPHSKETLTRNQEDLGLVQLSPHWKVLSLIPQRLWRLFHWCERQSGKAEIERHRERAHPLVHSLNPQGRRRLKPDLPHGWQEPNSWVRVCFSQAQQQEAGWEAEPGPDTRWSDKDLDIFKGFCTCCAMMPALTTLSEQVLGVQQRSAEAHFLKEQGHWEGMWARMGRKKCPPATEPNPAGRMKPSGEYQVSRYLLRACLGIPTRWV